MKPVQIGFHHDLKENEDSQASQHSEKMFILAQFDSTEYKRLIQLTEPEYFPQSESEKGENII